MVTKNQNPLLPQIIANNAGASPDRVFLQEVGGPDHSFGAFHEDALRWASGFERLGVAAGDLVATMLPTSVVPYTCWLGLAWLRAVDVALNTEYRGRMLAYVLNDCRAEVLVADERFLDRLADIAPGLQYLKSVVVPDPSGPPPSLPFRVITTPEFLDDAAVVEREAPRRRDSCAIIYTSGTTGASKGVVMPWGAIEQVGHGAFPNDRAEDYDDGGYYTMWPTFHGSGKASLVLSAQLGLRVVVRGRFSVTSFWDDVNAYDCTHASLLFISRLLLQIPPRPDDASNPLRRAGMYPVIPEYREFERRFGVRVATAWGMTEAGLALCTDDPVNYRTCGRPSPGYQLRIADEDDYPVPDNTVGELLVRHDEPWRVNMGYLGKPDVTAHAWRNGWFHTGDAFVRDENGDYYFVDRLKDCLKRRGENVSSLEVEAEVNAHPQIVESACVGVASDLAGDAGHDGEHRVMDDEDVKVVAVRKEGGDLTEEELMTYLIPRMARFMLPRYIQFVDALPKTPTNKVRKSELRDAHPSSRGWDREAAGIVVPH